jgi:nucleoside-diphosphate-sugar epimerase
MKGHEVCFHVAGKVGVWGKEKDFYNINVVGTQNIINACKKNGIKHLIYTSSPSVVFGKSALSGVDESWPYPTEYCAHYPKTKAQAEKRALDSNGDELKVVALRPHLIFGPGDTNLIPRVVEGAKSGRVKIVGDGQNLVDITYVENASQAHILAFQKLLSEPEVVAGKAYFIGQGPIKIWDFINDVLDLYQVPRLKKQISFKTAYRIGSLLETTYSLFGMTKKEPPMTRFVAMQLAKDHYFDHTNAERDLGWKPKYSIEDGLKKLRP